MKKIEEHIYELLFTQDCVIIPNFGGFVGQYNTSKFDNKNNLFTPPSKSASFNKHLKNDDGLLTHYVANSQKISYNEATETIKKYVITLKNELQTNKRIEISKIGTLYLDKDSSLKFKTSNTNFSTKYFGLPVVKPLIKKVIETKKEIALKIVTEETRVQEKETPIIPIQSVKKSKSINYWWAAAVIIPIIFYSAWIPLKTDLISNSKQFHYSDLNPFTFQKFKTYKQQTISKVNFDRLVFENKYPNEIIKVSLDDSSYLWVDNRIEVPAAKRETTFVETAEINLVNKISIGKTYHLISGCFEDKENAENFVNQLKEKGYTAKILDKNKGLHRVSIAEYTKRSTAKKAKELLESQQEINSWILKK